MKIIFFGDIVGKAGRQGIAKLLPELRERERPDVVIANVENLAHGRGVTKQTIDEIFQAGVDIATSGNHVFDKPEGLATVVDAYPDRLVRPANLDAALPGKGVVGVSYHGKNISIINLLGQVFMERQWEKGPIVSPFSTLSELLAQASGADQQVVLLDFHAEATSEKQAMGWYADGKVTAVLGTHTHVPTADARLLPQGTAYITDVGMTGVLDSIIGVDRGSALGRFLGEQTTLDPAEGDIVLANYVILEVDEQTHRALTITHRSETVRTSER